MCAIFGSWCLADLFVYILESNRVSQWLEHIICYQFDFLYILKTTFFHMLNGILLVQGMYYFLLLGMFFDIFGVFDVVAK